MKPPSAITSTMPSNPAKLKMIWLQGITCNGNTHSFLNDPALETLLESSEFIHHPLLPCSMNLRQLVKKLPKSDILIFEGAYKADFERAGMRMEELLNALASKAKHIIAMGSCASFGGIFKEADPEHISGILFDKEKESGPLKEMREKVITLSGCPAHPKWLSFVIEMMRLEKTIAVDEFRRPKELYAYLVHNGCLRNEYFEWKVDSDTFGTKEGCLFYAQGCQGPFTHGSCNKILWNEVSSKTRSGTPCVGCTEPTFPKRELFTTKTYMSIPAEMPLGVPKRSYLALAGAAKSFHIKRLEGKLIDDNA
ncbi:hydrogenase [Sulfuricurvum sp.]|uniref:NADH-quinone oxidoreductase subunit B family protein n=1 Tax=Sulfuricurvum sp. TaxID=2025608 RepID=UPI002D395672|nr:hydrogenase [Sulfuricurvum sp.]HZF70917.1 hydrogenase [Sulfuricurvum sp.]